MPIFVVSDLPYAVFASILAAILWASFVMLILASRRRNHWLRRFGLMLVTANTALFWTVSAWMRIGGEPNPILLNNWSRALYAMFGFYVLGYSYFQWRHNYDP